MWGHAARQRYVSIISDEEITARLAVYGKLLKVALGVEVEETYLHYSKVFLRSTLWDPLTWTDPQKPPSFAQMLEDQVPTARKVAVVTNYTRDLASMSFAESRYIPGTKHPWKMWPDTASEPPCRKGR